jgi:hypothetical protein
MKMGKVVSHVAFLLFALSGSSAASAGAFVVNGTFSTPFSNQPVETMPYKITIIEPNSSPEDVDQVTVAIDGQVFQLIWDQMPYPGSLMRTYGIENLDLTATVTWCGTDIATAEVARYFPAWLDQESLRYKCENGDLMSLIGKFDLRRYESSTYGYLTFRTGVTRKLLCVENANATDGVMATCQGQAGISAVMSKSAHYPSGMQIEIRSPELDQASEFSCKFAHSDL